MFGIVRSKLLELVEEGSGFAVAVRVDERDTMRKLLLGDVSEHAAKDRDPDAAGDEHVFPIGVLGKDEVSLRLLDVDFGADRQLREGALKGAVSEPRAETEHTALVRCGHDGKVPARTLVVLVGWIEERHPEVLARREVDLCPQQVEGDHEGSLRDLSLLFDVCAHVPNLTRSEAQFRQ